MIRELVFVHGRSQQGKDPDKLKQEWVDCLNAGLEKSGLPAIDPTRVRFPFYGNTLDQLSRGMEADKATSVVLKGEVVWEGDIDDQAKKFMYRVLDEVRKTHGVTDAEIQEATGSEVTEKGPLNLPWIRAMLQKLDTLPQVSAATIALVTYDVYQYVTNAAIRRKIDEGVQEAMMPDVESIVVAHSLGTVVAYTLLQREAARRNWKVPLLVTVGSPLAVNAIRNLVPSLGGVGGNRTPEGVTAWFNAMDSRDAVALHPLDVDHFRLNPSEPAIENKVDVDNPTDNRHGISGYLGDPVVAQRIHRALTEP